MDYTEQHQRIDESQEDSFDVTGITNASPGPALVSNSSLDSPMILATADGDPVEPSVQVGEQTLFVVKSENKEDARPAVVETTKEQEEEVEKAAVDQLQEQEEEVEKAAVDQLQEQDERRLSAANETWTKSQDITSNELLHQTFKSAINLSRDSLELEKEEVDEHKDEKSDNNEDKEDPREKGKQADYKMEFTKNYSDDLLMGAGEQARTSTESGGPDLADFELPPYNGSSSGSEQATSTKQHLPVKQRKSSNTANTQASSSPSSSAGLAPSDLTAVKNILISSYSKMAHVFHWKKPIESGIIFAIGLTFIAALTYFSIISVVAYSALGMVLASALIRVYKASMKALNKSSETPMDHIWERALAFNVSMSPERMHELIDSSHANMNAALVYFKQVLLVEDKVATFKFFLFLYSLTYIGAWFNGLTLITIVYVSLFSVPIFYEKNRTKIDEYMNLATGQVSCAISMVTSRVTALAFGNQSGTSSAKKQN